MQRKNVSQRIHYLNDEDVRTAIFHWLHTVAGCPPKDDERMTVTAGVISAVTITYTSDGPLAGPVSAQ